MTENKGRFTALLRGKIGGGSPGMRVSDDWLMDKMVRFLIIQIQNLLITFYYIKLLFKRLKMEIILVSRIACFVIYSA